jgi:hypothetical protein
MIGAVLLLTLVQAELGPEDAGPGYAAPPLQLRLEDLADPRRPVLALELAAAGETSPAAAPGVDAARVASLQFWGRTLRWSTATALVATSVLGTMAAINQPTAFGDGRCITGNPVLGEYGCDRGLSTLHGSVAVLSVTLYTANGVLRLAAPESKGFVAEPLRPIHHVLGWVSLVGIIVQPALGLIAAYPQVVGMSNAAPTDPFPRNLRTVHLFIGYVTTVAFLTATIMEP